MADGVNLNVFQEVCCRGEYKGLAYSSMYEKAEMLIWVCFFDDSLRGNA